MPVVVASSGFSVNFESHDMADDTTKRDRRDHSRVNMRDAANTGGADSADSDD